MLVPLIIAQLAQDPAHGWMAYAVGAIPDKFDRITRLEMTWTVGEEPRHRGRAFFSPWFGMDPADNLNLVQPVNPWMGRGWSAYTEYFQWRPEHNSNSGSFDVRAKQTLHGSIEYLADDDAYLLKQTCLESGAVSSQKVPCQRGKKYNIPYVVYEKTFPCRYYPPDEVVTFRNITVECDGSPCKVAWDTKVKDANCNMTAHVDPAHNEISITWNTRLESKYDAMADDALLALNGGHGWGKRAAEAMRQVEEEVVD